MAILMAILLGSADANEIISPRNVNFIQSSRRSSLVTIPGQVWGFSGDIFDLGLPGYCQKYYYNNLSSKDPFYGTTPFAWLNPRYTSITLENQRINLKPNFTTNEALYSRFDWYRANNNFGLFGAILSGSVADYQFSLYGENFNFSGNHGSFSPDPVQLDKSVAQNFALDVRKKASEFTLDAGINYKKFNTGNISFTEASDNQTLLQIPQYNGSIRKFRKQAYLYYTKTDSLDSLSIGGQLSNFDYSYKDLEQSYNWVGYGNTHQLFIERFNFFANDTISYAADYKGQGVYFKSGESRKKTIFNLSLQSNGEKLGIDYFAKFLLRNEMALYQLHLRKEIFGGFFSEVESRLNYAQYPFAFFLSPAVKTPIEDDGFTSWKNSLTVGFNYNFISFKTTLDYQQSEFFRPYKSAMTDTLVQFLENQLDDFYINSAITINLPWQMELFGKVQYSPTVDPDQFYYLHAYGSILQEVTLFHGNLNLYVKGSVAYFAGGEKLHWFNGFQTSGVMDDNYYTNEPLSFSGELGFRVGSLHMFYRINNIENRAFTVMQSMPLQSRLMILGVEWYFWN